MPLPLHPASHCIRCTTIRAASWRSEMEQKLGRYLLTVTNNTNEENRFKLNTYLGLRPIVKRAQWDWHLTIANYTCLMTRSVRRPSHRPIVASFDVNLNRILSIYNRRIECLHSENEETKQRYRSLWLWRHWRHRSTTAEAATTESRQRIQQLWFEIDRLMSDHLGQLDQTIPK